MVVEKLKIPRMKKVIFQKQPNLIWVLAFSIVRGHGEGVPLVEQPSKSNIFFMDDKKESA